jgi:hypothetical protein
MSKRRDIFERVDHDIDRGDFALARTRLESYLNRCGYDPDLLARLGRIASDMHDPANAGRFWLTSNATGEAVETAIAEFIRRCGGQPEEIALRLPRAARLPRIDEYPSLVRERLQKQGLVEKVIWAGKRREGIREAVTGSGWLVIAIAAIVLVGICGTFVAGIVSIVEFLFG